MEVRIVGTELPGTRCDDGRNPAYENVHVGVQCRKDVVELVPGDAPGATWDLAVDVAPGDDLDFRGPYVHGKRGDRFLYLSWGTVDRAGTFEMFRRAKLLLSPIDPAVVHEAAGEGRRLVGSVRLTDSCGLPRCASVKPDAMEWSAD
jgi:hypothetical protein